MVLSDVVNAISHQCINLIKDEHDYQYQRISLWNIKNQDKKAFQLSVIQKINANKQHTLVISCGTEPVSNHGPQIMRQAWIIKHYPTAIVYY